MNRIDERTAVEAVAHDRRSPPRCPRCQLETFWCPTCAEAAGAWVCGCTHPRQARDMAEAPLVSPTLVIGQLVCWQSPLFGKLTGAYLGPMGTRQLRVEHPLSEQEAVIASTWLVDVD